MIRAVRGANSVKKNDRKSMEEAVYELISSIVKKNKIEKEKIISIIFSQTKDLNIANPAAALRVSGEYSYVPLFCTQEPEYEDSASSFLRVLMTYETVYTQKVIPVYLNEASKLRIDLELSEKE